MRSALNFNWIVSRAVFNQQIDFLKSGVSIEKEVRTFSVVKPTLQNLNNDKVFKKIISSPPRASFDYKRDACCDCAGIRSERIRECC